MADFSYNLAEAGLDDGTIDFYTLLQESPDTDVETLRTKIQTLYNEAQANRDHRNLNKRREYQTLLDWLPRARAALLEPEKRARYNAYLSSVKSGTPEIGFEEFMADLLGQNESMEEKTGVLGVQDKSQAPRARVISTPVNVPQVNRPKAPAPASSAPTRAIGGAVAGLIVGALIGYAIGGIVPAILIAFIVAAIAFALLNSKPRGGIRS
ncbi:hypothetical protein B1R32_101148 [Abditibacterium utsteinense]|uniref:Uncharacterized protein n=1 Tax=Abditibacterium utsteinense TaxID=1960156 RepID=A0A2S8SX84_9BACT|nr:hypothetical protein [Abditibacterium utsteinense]PQV65407.1 hypothetical protein B1R32_101148 [Abditibacterium utsteinense]